MNEAAQKIVKLTDWPEREEEATADALILHGARIAVALQVETDRRFEAWSGAERGTDEHKIALKAYLDSMSGMIAEAQVVIALVQVQKRDREQADVLARVLYELTEDGGVLPELMWDYLTERGIDAQSVWDAAKAEHEPESNDSET